MAGLHTYEQAPVRAAVYGQLGRRRVALFDEIFSRTLEVCEAVLLVGQHASLKEGITKYVRGGSFRWCQPARWMRTTALTFVPGLPVLASSSNVGDGQDSS